MMFEIVFFTSSKIKLSHARHLCRDYNVKVTSFREKTFHANYIEPRIYDREELLKQSYEDALQRWQKAVSKGENRLFFIEDTSVTIDALSIERETPGLDVKYWMEETDFANLDQQLKALGNNRKATVRSDVVLHLSPELRKATEDKNYLCFVSSVSGQVVDVEQSFDTNPMYPWLDNKTFNKWFMPDGCSLPVSLLAIEEADKHDFRANAFQQMLAFLEQHKIITRRTTPVVQSSLDSEESLFIICGPTCSGKSTLAEHLADNYGYYHIEASDFMYLSYYQRHGVASSVSIGDFAEQALHDQPEIVADQILENIEKNQIAPIVVTGFRSPLEVEWFRHYYAGSYRIVIVYIMADAELRFKRALLRQREDQLDSREKFDKRDAQQASMGLLELEERFKSDLIENNGSLEELFSYFEKNYLKNHQKNPINNQTEQLKGRKLENLILMTLAKQLPNRGYFTTTEIAHLMNQFLEDQPKSKNNISRYFNQRFYPYFEIKVIDGKRKYRLSNTGHGKARILLKNKPINLHPPTAESPAT
ncbi:non-canonical purine NTP pyrophosphatase [Methylovulum miyakonense]|uniref:non-canonical purine NTP pyrophosphatase n=1 Tax=Methylovulum miyakonense TaxID=645578 RepID=UPI0003725B4D|nr:non-canonical purine NTP pyrophosphatase [Methylovulum miyakonense]